MPFFREAMRIGEKDRQEINKLLALLTPLWAVLNRIFDDASNLIAGAEVQAERMRMQLLYWEDQDYCRNRMSYDYDYKMPRRIKPRWELAIL